VANLYSRQMYWQAVWDCGTASRPYYQVAKEHRTSSLNPSKLHVSEALQEGCSEVDGSRRVVPTEKWKAILTGRVVHLRQTPNCEQYHDVYKLHLDSFNMGLGSINRCGTAIAWPRVTWCLRAKSLPLMSGYYCRKMLPDRSQQLSSICPIQR
jgi:hypothetical protein